MPSFLEREQLMQVQPYIQNPQSVLELYKTSLELYGRGAGSIKSQYDQFKNLELTRDSNKATLNQAIGQVDSNLMTSAKMDFRVLDNVKTAGQSFNPLFANNAAINNMWGDYGTTKSFNKAFAQADNDRTREGGKFFNQAGYQKQLMAKEMFRNNSSDGSWNYFKSKADEGYRSAHDIQAENFALAKNFKTDVLEKLEAQNNGYSIYTKDASWVAEKYAQYVQANASDEYKRQLKDNSEAEFRTDYVNVQNIKGNTPQETELMRKQYIDQHYTVPFNAFKQEKLNSIDDQMGQAQVALIGINKNTKDAIEKKAELNDYIKQLSTARTTVEGYQMPVGFGTEGNIYGSEEFVTDLVSNKHFANIGRAYAHKDVSEKMVNDTSYWARMGLNHDIAKMEQDQLQFNLDIKYKYDKMSSDEKMAMAVNNLKMAELGLKYDSKGNLQSSTSSYYATPDVSKIKTPPTMEEIGKDLYEGREQTMSSTAHAGFNAMFSNYFDNPAFIDALTSTENVNKRFADIRIQGSNSIEDPKQIIQFLKGTIPQGITLNGKKWTAAEVETPEFERMINNSKPGDIMNLLYLSLQYSNTKDKVYEGAKAKGKLGFDNTYEDLMNGIKNADENFDYTYGSVVKDELVKYGYPAKVEVGSPEYLAGIRGYNQDGVYRVPKKNELDAFARIKSPSSTTTIDMGDGTTATVTATPEKISGDLYKGITTAIGRQGGISTHNILGSTDIVTDKNRQLYVNEIQSVTRNMVENNKETDAYTQNLMARIANDSPQAIISYSRFGSLVNGDPRISLTFDASKIENVKDREEYELIGNPSNIRINARQGNLPEEFKRFDPTYLAALTNELKQTRTLSGYGINGETTLSLRNMSNDRETPNFVLQGSFVKPIEVKPGEFARTADGKLALQVVSADQLNGSPYMGGMNFATIAKTDVTAAWNSLTSTANKYNLLIKKLDELKVSTTAALEAADPTFFKKINTLFNK